MMIETTKLCNLVSVWVTLTFIQDQNCLRNHKLCACSFSFFLGGKGGGRRHKWYSMERTVWM